MSAASQEVYRKQFPADGNLAEALAEVEARLHVLAVGVAEEEERVDAGVARIERAVAGQVYTVVAGPPLLCLQRNVERPADIGW